MAAPAPASAINLRQRPRLRVRTRVGHTTCASHSLTGRRAARERRVRTTHTAGTRPSRARAHLDDLLGVRRISLCALLSARLGCVSRGVLHAAVCRLVQWMASSTHRRKPPVPLRERVPADEKCRVLWMWATELNFQYTTCIVYRVSCILIHENNTKIIHDKLI